MATSPVFAVTPRIGMAQVSVANTNRDGTGTGLVDVIVGATTGTKISEVVVEATVTTTAGMVRLFLNDGTTTRLFDEITVAAATASNTARTTRVSTLYQNLTLPSNAWKLIAGTSIANAINVIAFGADL
jgi:hypothetical protein